MKREYPESPIIGVGGVIFHEDSVLLVKRAQEPGIGQWSFPGGAVELGETLIEALKREIYEETSLEIEVKGLVRVLDRIITDQEKRVQYHYVIIDYWAWKVSGKLHPASDISDACFVPLNQVQHMGVQQPVEETILMALTLRSNDENHRIS